MSRRLPRGRRTLAAGAALALGVVAAGSAQAVIIRHDRDDARYVELAKGLSGICHLNLRHKDAAPDGEGVLVAPDWVLTAAHVAEEIRPGHVLSVIGDGVREYVEADTAFIHPDWDGGAHDIALVRLRTPVETVAPVPLYRGRDEAGRVLLIGGAGDFGTGKTGPKKNDGRLRAATNRIDEASDNWLEFRFDPPDEATDLEGVSGPGDSGGPGFLEVDGVRYVAGVSSGQSTRDTGGHEGLYGVREFYTRVSSHLDWLDGLLGR